VAKVYDSLPPDERAQAAIFGKNYGEAAAVDFFGPRYGLPKAISGHMGYYVWGPGNWNGKVLIAIVRNDTALKQGFGDVEQAASVGTRYSMPDEHVNIYVCRDPKFTVQEMWPLTKLYD
jgi:hypothetical protein